MSRILLASHPFDGHFNPFSALATHLRDEGHDVRWYTGPSYADKVRAHGVPYYPFVRAHEITADTIDEEFPDYASQSARRKSFEGEICKMFFSPIEPMYRDVREIYEGGFEFDAMFCDAALFMSRIVAEKLPVRMYVVNASQTPTPTSTTAPAPFFGFRPARTVVGRVRDRLVGRLLHRMSRMGMAMFNDLRAREGLPPYRGSTFDMHVEKSRAFFQVGAPGLDFPREDWPDNFRFIGALAPSRQPGELPPTLTAKLAEGRPVVVVSQGTTDNRDETKLFVPTLEALAGGECLVIATTGGRHTEELRRRFPQDNVVVEDWLDYHALLPHTQVLISNGGFGTVLLALSHGVPVLAAGKLEGKVDVNARLAHHGLGIDLGTERPSRRRIARAVARILRDPGYRERVARARAELASYRPLQIISEQLAADGLAPVAPPLQRAN